MSLCRIAFAQTPSGAVRQPCKLRRNLHCIQVGASIPGWHTRGLPGYKHKLV